MKTALRFLFAISLIILQASCEKEITIDLPPSPKLLVVEASINQSFTNLNYVFITQSLDYFNPDLSLNGIGNALVYITPGKVIGIDTLWDTQNRIQFFDATSIPLPDSIVNEIKGIYVNLLFQPQVGVPYKLDIEVEGKTISGVTSIPKVVPIDTIYWQTEFDVSENDTDVFVTFEFEDSPQQDNYRLAYYNGSNPILLGWGSANSFRTFDDSFINNGKRIYSFFSPFNYGDTLNLYLSCIGRKEYLFWESFSDVVNSGGPFTTPVWVKSNISGAIGSFTGYGVAFKSAILK